MADDKNIQENIAKASADVISNLVYTITSDIINEAIGAGVDQGVMLECANKVVNRYVEGGVKVRKKPAPRAKAPKVVKDKPDALTAASRKMSSNVANNATWMHHPDDNNYSYTTNVRLSNGWPVRNNATGKIEYVVTDETTMPITLNDAKLAMGFGFEIDYSSIQQ